MSVDPASLSIVFYPDPALRRKADPVEEIDATVRATAARMIDLMHEAEGVGLAAPQVGLPWRMFVTSAEAGEDAIDRVYINPRLSGFSPDLVPREEGCLSLPGVTAEIRRPGAVTVTATDIDGAAFTLTDGELLARVWQHEVDHLDGVLIIDKMTPMDRIAMRRVIKELEAAAG
jgi:peptide deformylase